LRISIFRKFTWDDKKNNIVLIVNNYAKQLEKITAREDISPIQPIKVRILEEAIFVIEDKSCAIKGLFVSVHLPDYSWIQVIQSFHKHRAGAPLFLLKDKEINLDEILTENEISKLGVRKILDKDTDFSEMLKEVAPMSIGFDVVSVLEKADKSQVDSMSDSGDEEFSSISAENFLSGTNSIFDIYVRLSGKKFLKICQAGLVFEQERVEKYLKKGVTHFYIRKEVQENYLNYCEHITKKIIKNKNISTDVKVSQTLNLGEQTMSFLKNGSVDEKSLEAASSFVNTTREMFDQFCPAKGSIMDSFLSDLAGQEHGVATTMLSALMAKTMGIESTCGVEILGMAALLHNIGLVGMPEVYMTEDESQMTEEQIRIYRNHPAIGAKELEKIPDVNSTVVGAVAEHHVRRNNMGFPKSLTYGRTSVVSQIVGLSSEFAHCISKSEKDLKLDPYKSMEEKVFGGFSLQLIKAFQSSMGH